MTTTSWKWPAPVEAFLATLPEDVRKNTERLGCSALCHLAEVGDLPGWAYVSGFCVRWFPTRGIAKRSWYLERQRLRKERNETNNPAIFALGPKPEPTTLLDAYIWEG